MRRPNPPTAMVAVALVVVGVGTVIHALLDPTSGLAGRHFEGTRWVHGGNAQELVPADNIVVGFSSSSAGLLADTDCSNVHGTVTVSGGRLFLADIGSLGSSIALPESPTLPGSCFDQPRRQRAERLDAFFERGPTVEIRPGFLVLRGQGSTLVLAER